MMVNNGPPPLLPPPPLQADALPDPGDTFRFMFVNRIGADVALFYMAWAWLAEHKCECSM